MARRKLLFGAWLSRTLQALVCVVLLASSVRAQGFDASWLDTSRPWAKLGVVRDGIYAVTGSALSAAGVPIGSIDPSTLRIFENGREIPVRVEATSGLLGAADRVVWVGQRQRGDDELWAFADRADYQSSTYYSLYSDTTYYWLTWGGSAGLRYAAPTPVASPAPVTSLPAVIHQESDDLYFNGDGDAAISNPLYTRGEGYYMHQLRHSTVASVSRDYAVNVPGIDRAAGGDVTVTVQINSETASGHRAVLYVERSVGGGPAAYVAADSAAWIGYGFATLSASIPQGEVPSAAEAVRFRVVSRNGTDVNPSAAPNSLLVDYVEVVATTRPTAVEGQTEFTLPQSTGFSIDLSGPASGESLLVLEPSSAVGALIAANAPFVDSGDAGATYYVARQSAARAPVKVLYRPPGSIRNLTDAALAADYLILTTALLRPSAELIAAYRSGSEGGNHRVLIVETRELFDQFDYGRRRPIAIRRFIDATRSWAGPPEYLMFWGDTQWPSRKVRHEAWETISFGKSSSDGWFSMQWDGPDDWSEALHTGRIPVRDNVEGERFVQKIKHYESRPPADWMKRAMILAGGAGEAQQSTLQFYSNGWGQTIANYPFGGDVTNYYKTSETVLDPTFRDSIEASIEMGAAWLGYFGHSSATRWEIVTDPPEEFNNADVLPVALSLGCYNGAFGSSTRVFAEDVVLGSMNGSIAHWGGTSASFIGPAANIATPFYNVVFFEGERILGRALTEAKSRYVSIGGSLTISTNLQYNLIGDPATRMNLPEMPDFYVDDSSVRFEPFAPNLADETLTVEVTVNNRGLVPQDSLLIQIVHWAPDDTRTEYRRKIPRVYLSDRVAIEIPVQDFMVGENRFAVTLDPDAAIGEGDELNNVVEKTVIVFSSGLALVYPTDYGLVTEADPILRVSLTSQEEEGTPVVFELDTAATFDSGALRRETVTSSLAVEWQPASPPLEDGKTYYWRARVDDPTQPDVDWKTASFTLREDLTGEGWYQQGRQFDANRHGNFIEFGDEAWAFKEFSTEFRLVHGRELGVGAELYFRINPGWGAILIDGNSGEIRQITLASEPVEDQIAELEGLAASANPGDIVLARNRTFFSGWGWTDDNPATARVKAAFVSVGAVAVDTVAADEFWVMAGRVGETMQEWVLPRSGERVTRTVEYGFRFAQSESYSGLIGPARIWQNMVWTGGLANAEALLAVDVLSRDGLLLYSDTLRFPDSQKQIDLSALDPRHHPYIRLKATFADASKSSTPQLLNWYVRYASIPEIILDPGALTLSADTVSEGQPIDAAASILNLSQVAAPEVLVTYEVTDADNKTTTAAVDTLRNVGALETATSTATFSTQGLPGLNRLTVTARQQGLSEAVVYNNLVVRPFVVRADRVPPTFRVTIDGEEYPDDPRPVTSTDDPTLPFVNARPTIEILVQDDSEYLPLSDTAYVKVSIDGAPLSFDRPDLQFEPGTLQKNEARILFTPDFSGRDTTHTLTLWARDASGNANPTELEPYQVHFRIQNAAEVETLYPYPNPMNAFTNFAFQLRGADPGLVEDFRIRIYTLNGQLVREFDLVRDTGLLDGGALRIGWNKVPWDCRDADGHELANGVYLYKVFLKAEGRNLEVNNSSGIEKLVIIR